MAQLRDFPFYDGRPAKVSALGWLLVLAGCAAGFAALALLPRLAPGRPWGWVSIALFVALPLISLALATGGRWTAIFHRPTVRDIRIGLAFAPLTLLVSATMATVVMHVGVTAANPIVGLLTTLRGMDLVALLLATGPQLLGEEIITLLPFLAVLAGMHAMGAPRPAAIGVAWLITALMFGALHLSTYSWNVGQALLVIGSARIVLTGAYVLTKNVWASFIAHIAHDWSLFAFILAAHAVSRG